MIPFLVHWTATIFMTGLIWMVQVVHYPLFRFVGSDRYQGYQERHMRRITWVVGPAMVVEAATAVWIWRDPPAGVPINWLSANALLLLGIWVSTAALQVPAHERLRRGFDDAAHRKLVATNWVRTALWSIRTALLAFAGHAAFRPI